MKNESLSELLKELEEDAQFSRECEIEKWSNRNLDIANTLNLYSL